ncbi:MAG: DUF2807 domain-containing protein, partial [Bacteroidales bacterium]|nr:DUF2807 domain-containing protein [Bacteroidales bacterium]
MKKSVYLILAISTLFVFANCYYPNGSTSKENIKETREVPEFSGVNLGIAGNVYLKQGSPQEVVLEGDEDDLKNIITMVDGGILKIKVDDWMERINNRVNIYITIPEINDLSVSGSGDVIAEDKISTDDIELKVSGSGKIKIETLNARSINTKISGSGDVYLGGGNMAQEHNLKISGSGNLDAQNLSVNNYDI